MGTRAPIGRVVTEPRRVGNPYFPKYVPISAPEPQIKDPEKVAV